MKKAAFGAVRDAVVKYLTEHPGASASEVVKAFPQLGRSSIYKHYYDNRKKRKAKPETVVTASSGKIAMRMDLVVGEQPIDIGIDNGKPIALLRLTSAGIEVRKQQAKLNPQRITWDTLHKLAGAGLFQ